jgi:hypothetical protein
MAELMARPAICAANDNKQAGLRRAAVPQACKHLTAATTVLESAGKDVRAAWNHHVLSSGALVSVVRLLSWLQQSPEALQLDDGLAGLDDDSLGLLWSRAHAFMLLAIDVAPNEDGSWGPVVSHEVATGMNSCFTGADRPCIMAGHSHDIKPSVCSFDDCHVQ